MSLAPSSIQSSRRWLVGTVLSIVFACALVPLVGTTSTAKSEFVQKQHEQHGVLGKTDRLLDVQIYSPDLLPTHPNETLTLQGKIQLHRRALGPIQLHWELPAQAVVVKGDLNPTMLANAGDTQTFEISIRGLSWPQSNPLILLHARTLLAGHNVGASGVFPEETLRDIAEQSQPHRSLAAKPHAAPVLATSALLQF